jgi:hypothetical protein
MGENMGPAKAAFGRRNLFVPNPAFRKSRIEKWQRISNPVKHLK